MAFNLLQKGISALKAVKERFTHSHKLQAQPTKLVQVTPTAKSTVIAKGDITFLSKREKQAIHNQAYKTRIYRGLTSQKPMRAFGQCTPIGKVS